MFSNATNTNQNVFKQSLIALVTVILVASGCYFFDNFLGYKVVAFILLMTVSILAMLFEIVPVLLAATLSALIWNFFFINPIYTFHISNSEDMLMFLMYFLVAFVNTVLTVKIKKTEKKARDKEEKEKTIKLYNTLLNSLSHELRTPISAIIGSVDILQESDSKLTSENRKSLLNEIEIAGFKLNDQVENLLNMSRLESGILKLKMDWCDLNEQIRLVIQNHFLSNSRIIFKEEENFPICKLDIGILEQILINLIRNALLYTPENATVTIDMKLDENLLILTIEDNGLGIPEEHIHQIFDKFYRVPHTITGGTGLGLSIVKGFVEAHNGTIEVKNNTPSGLKFDIFVPVEITYLNQLKNE